MSDIALLAPVPLQHLESAADLRGPYVAFGSNAFELFRELDLLRDGQGVPALIYASHDGMAPSMQVEWLGKYIGHIDAKNRPHPEENSVRPPTAHNDGQWAVFWHVEGLNSIEPCPLLQLDAFKTRELKPVLPRPPRGPVLIHVGRDLNELISKVGHR